VGDRRQFVQAQRIDEVILNVQKNAKHPLFVILPGD